MSPMFTLTEAVLQAAFDHAAQCAPRESCGLVVCVDGAQIYYACANRAIAENEFVIDAFDAAAAEEVGHVLAVVHSHPGELRIVPTSHDWVGCETSGLPWVIVGDNGAVATLRPLAADRPLIGREFRYGVTDCYALVRDWYAAQLAIVLPDFVRPPEGWWRNADGPDAFVRQFAQAGFFDFGKSLNLQAGDVLLMQIRAAQVNHVAVYVGDGLMLHHLYNRLSGQEPYSPAWQHLTRTVARFAGAAKGAAA
jgi:cell wall-associated NlpC family hydrolase